MKAPTAEAWSPPLDAGDLRTLLAACQAWRPFDGELLLDDVGAILDDVVPDKESLTGHDHRLRGHLMQLVAIAVAADVDQDDPEARRLIERARHLHEAALPGDHPRAVGHLRRMAWSVNELHERLGALHCLREAA